ncbi:siderophore ABC transporter substrate-binding protein [Caldibacillus lycopersici]|uniref:Siderophore ABC transporter substrate-binding protein n=1 Tax=Perspicuibacillus lycopersici TaxID=1325689 RepID=A0AAE3IV23_9BACI|nr:siderophore ABC transporter substrate-binding protein [Perspicuibacillus lycopersici]MCU9612570.1 siderophore ABC transporter substrate-binding protein [Perspicuibacillus lycopersici]
MKKSIYLGLFLMLSLILTACGTSDSNSNASSGDKEKETVSIKHELDENEVEVPKNPKKVVVFDFGSLDTLDKMGVEVVGIPKDSLPTYLDKYADDKYENVGGLKEPDFEKIAEIGPDLIIISGRQGEQYEEFKEIAPTIYLALDTSNYIDSFKANARTLGKIFDKEDFVEDELVKIDDRMAQVKEEVTALNKNALIILANDGKISAYGAGSRFGLIHDVLGFTPSDPNIEVSTHGQSVSFEYVMEQDPDYLFVVDRTAVVGGETGAKEVVENELTKNTKAYKEGHIVYLDPDYWYLSGGGLISVSEMISEVEASLK